MSWRNLPSDHGRQTKLNNARARPVQGAAGLVDYVLFVRRSGSAPYARYN
jgi:hypothetical protein